MLTKVELHPRTQVQVVFTLVDPYHLTDMAKPCPLSLNLTHPLLCEACLELLATLH